MFGSLNLGLGLGEGQPAPSGGGDDGGGGDPHFANVVFLSSFDGTDGATTATDDSNSAHALTFVGNAQIDTAQSRFGGSSLLIGASGDRVTAPDSDDWHLQDGTGQPFTIEAWVRPSAINTSYHFIAAQSGAGNQTAWAVALNQYGDGVHGSLFFFRSSTGESVTPLMTGSYTAIAINIWHHVAVDFDGTTYRAYVNGALTASSSSAGEIFNSTAKLSIGAKDGGGQQYFGHIDELRITKGVARYASDAGFTVPTEAFPRS